MEEEKIQCLVDSAAGVYIPKEFIEKYRNGFEGISEADAIILSNGPEEENYWEVWEYVMSSAVYHDLEGHSWSLYQDGDLFMMRDDWGGFGDY